MLKKIILLIAPVIVAFFFTVTAHGQEIPAGALVRIIDCSLQDGVTMADAVEQARSYSWDETSPNAVFFRQSVYGGSYRENYDFRIASYFPSYSEMISRYSAEKARQRRTKSAGFYTCDPATRRLTQAHPVNPGNNDGFTGDATLMATRFCRLNDGKTIADAYAFAQGVASNFANAGDNSLYQMYTLEQGATGELIGEGGSGRGLVLATVPATPEAFGERMDLSRDGFQPVENLRPLPVSCDAPSMWFTSAIHRGGNN